MFSDAHIIVLGDVHPFCLVFEYFADGAAFDAITGGDVLLACIWIILMVHANGLSVYIKETLLALLCPRDNRAHWRGREWIHSECLGIRSS